MSDEEQEAVAKVSKSILRERLAEHEGEALRAKAHFIYINAAPPKDDAPYAVQIVELATRHNLHARALFHSQEEERFREALKALEAS